MGRIIDVADGSLIILAGPSGSGKSTFARRFFVETAIVSSDRCRAMLSDSESNQAVSGLAFSLFYDIIDKRLSLGRTTVADSTALNPTYRATLRDIALRHNAPVVVVAFDLPETTLNQHDRTREGRSVGSMVIARQVESFHHSLAALEGEGMDAAYVIGPGELDSTELRVVHDEVDEGGSFDFIGDVHGCADELEALLGRLGYQPTAYLTWVHPLGRRAVFLGDLTDRGPRNLDVLLIVQNMVAAGSALYTPGNHCNKLMRWLMGRKVRIGYGLDVTIAEFDALPPAEREQTRQATISLVRDAPSYLILDGGKIVASHGGIKEHMVGRYDGDVISMCLYGDTTGETLPNGLPVRRDWAAEYHGWRFVVYGHTPVRVPEIRNQTINIDQGCVFGGWLTSFRWPELEIVQEPARRIYYANNAADLGQEERFGPLARLALVTGRVVAKSTAPQVQRSCLVAD